MEKSGLRTVAKPPGDPIFQENSVFLLEKHKIAAFVLVDKSGYFCGFPGKIWDNEAVEYKDCENHRRIKINEWLFRAFYFLHAGPLRKMY